MYLTRSTFFDSSLSVKENVIKNILFRISSLALQYATLNACAYVAFCMAEYTSFLMFAENLLQKVLYIISRRFKRSAIIILAFILLYTLASAYDTFLWALDSPGYVVRSRPMNGSELAPYLISNSPYVTIITEASNDPTRINLDTAMTNDLFVPGFNYSFPPTSYSRTPAAILPPPPLKSGIGQFGPRIYLDEEGFGVSFGQQLLEWNMPVEAGTCPTNLTGDHDNALTWWCVVPNTDSFSYLQQAVGALYVWWDDDFMKTTILTPFRSDNPWASQSTGGGTAMMKQVFTLTKGNKRHTFIQTTAKISMLKRAPELFSDDEITQLVRRVYAANDTNTDLADVYAKRLIDYQRNGLNSTTMGFMYQNVSSPSIAWSSIEFNNVVNPIVTTRRLMGLIRILDIVVTLVRSETLADEEIPKPAPPCNIYNVNQATGGRFRYSDCYYTPENQTDHPPENQTDTRYLGQVDTSAVAIFLDIFGDGRNDTNAVAFNQTSADWYAENYPRIDHLLLSRAYLHGGDRSTVQVDMKYNEAAISYLQLLLLLLPAAFALVAFLIMLRDRQGYYRNSFFSSLMTTTHIAPHTSCDKVRHLRKVPKLVLRSTRPSLSMQQEDNTEGSCSEKHIMIGTEDGRMIMAVPPEHNCHCHSPGRKDQNVNS